jgi:hypothetical protein
MTFVRRRTSTNVLSRRLVVLIRYHPARATVGVAVMAARTPNLRVPQVTPHCAPSVGGVETHVLEVCRRLHGEGIEVAVLTADETGSLSAREVLDGIAVQRVRAFPRGRDLLRLSGLALLIEGVAESASACRHPAHEPEQASSGGRVERQCPASGPQHGFALSRG